MATPIYTVIMLASIVCCSVLLRRFQVRLPISTANKFVLGIVAFCGAMIGAKLPFVVADIGNVGLVDIVSGTTWLADGKTIMFGLVGGYAAVSIAKWFLGIKVRTGDSYAYPVATAVSIGRLGCFYGGCCFGTVTNCLGEFTFPM